MLAPITAQIQTTINPAYSDTYIIRKFAELTAGYLTGTAQQIQIRSYSRSSSYPMKLSVSFSHCAWYSMLSGLTSQSSSAGYTSNVRAVFDKLLVKSHSSSFVANQLYSNALLSTFNLLSIKANDWCYKPPNMPPKINVTISVITVAQCTAFSYKIPASAYSDEDGNARNLALQLYDKSGNSLMASSWVAFNTALQTIHGKPNRQAYLTQTPSGYKYILKATDRYGLSKSMDVYINISGTISPPSNTPPVIKLNNYGVTVPSCGIFRQKLPNDFASDKEDGSLKNLTVVMKMSDGTALSQDSWVQFDSNTYEIVALPSDAITSVVGMKWRYQIVVSDSCGGTSSTIIRILTQKHQISYQNHVFSFQTSLSQSTPNLFVLEKFLTKTAGYFKESAENYRVVSSTKSAVTGYYTLKFSNCSINQYICLNVHREIINQQNIFRSSSQNLHSFSTYMSKWFRITAYRNETSYIVDRPPTIKPTAKTDIHVTTCGSYSQDVSRSVFSHRSPNTLVYSIALLNGQSIPKTYPIQLMTSTLYVVSLGNSGSYSFRLTATDRCGQSVNTTLKVRISIPFRPIGYRIKVQSTIETSHSSVYYILQFMQALREQMGDPSYQISVASFSKVISRALLIAGSEFHLFLFCLRFYLTY